MNHQKNCSTSENSKGQIVVNRTVYGLFVLSAIVFLILTKDYAMACSQLGIALVFDPFNPKQKWNDRPLYQKAWLIVHLIIVFSLLVVGIVLKK
jgi:hypothetical protein